MSASDKVDPLEAWRFAEKLLADEELERLDRMTDEQLEAELRAEGRGASWVPSAESLMAGAASHAARDATAKAVVAPIGAKVAPLPRRTRSSALLWLVAAGFALLVGGLAATRGAAIVAWLRGTPEPILPDNTPPRPPTPHEIAEEMRDEAGAACTEQLWGRCRDKLDAAKMIDPAGDDEPRVQQMRQAIVDATAIKPRPKDPRLPK